jgi:hypothetical protein
LGSWVWSQWLGLGIVVIGLIWSMRGAFRLFRLPKPARRAAQPDLSRAEVPLREISPAVVDVWERAPRPARRDFSEVEAGLEESVVFLSALPSLQVHAETILEQARVSYCPRDGVQPETQVLASVWTLIGAYAPNYLSDPLYRETLQDALKAVDAMEGGEGALQLIWASGGEPFRGDRHRAIPLSDAALGLRVRELIRVGFRRGDFCLPAWVTADA